MIGQLFLDSVCPVCFVTTKQTPRKKWLRHYLLAHPPPYGKKCSKLIKKVNFENIEQKK